jgi:hypothetical protein
MPRCVAALALILVAALASTASAESGPEPGTPPPPGQTAPQPPAGGGMQIDVRAVDPGAGATVVLHCVPPELAGKEVVLALGADVELALLVPGARLMAVIDLPAKLLVKVKAVPAGGECGPMQPAPGQPAPGKSGPGGAGDDQKTAEFRSGFINRVWKFRGSSSSFDAGVLNITVEKILNLPRKFRDQDDDVLDQDAYVLVGPKTKVFDADGHRVGQSALDDADTVVVEGKLLRPAKWKQDEDDTPVVTIRAKRIHISS